MEPTPPVGWVAPEPTASSGRSGVWLVGFIPLVFAVAISILAPGFYGPMLDTTVASGGASLGIPLLLIAGALMLAGVVVMWRFPNVAGVVIALVCFTSPSLFLVLIGPAICLIAQNMTT